MAATARVSGLHAQPAHGFTRLTAVRFDGANWVRAAAGDPGIGLVGSVPTSDSFEYVTLGELDGLDGLVPGEMYYVGAAGQLTRTASGPPIFQAYTDRRGFVLQGVATAEPAPAPLADATLAAKILSLENEIARLEARVVTDEPTDDTAADDARYLRRDVWVIDTDNDRDGGEIVIDVDNLTPVYCTEEDSFIPVIAGFVLPDVSALAIGGAVHSTLLVGPLLYVGGDFTTVTDAGGTITRHGAACLNLTTARWTTWDPAVTIASGTAGVHGMCLSADTASIYLTGGFDHVGGDAHTNLAKVAAGSAATVYSWAPSGALNGVGVGVTAHPTNGLVYVGGAFSLVGATARHMFAAFSDSAGTLDAWDPQAQRVGDRGNAPILASGVMYLTGQFTGLATGIANHNFYAAKVDPATGNADTAWTSPLPYNAHPNTFSDVSLLAGSALLVSETGGFPGANYHYLADLITGARIGSFNLTCAPDNGVVDLCPVWALTWDPAGGGSDPYYVGGTFDHVNSTARTNLCAVSKATGAPTTDWATIAPNGAVERLEWYNGYVIALGSFTSIGGATRARIAFIAPATGTIQ